MWYEKWLNYYNAIIIQNVSSFLKVHTKFVEERQHLDMKHCMCQKKKKVSGEPVHSDAQMMINKRAIM